MATVELRLTPQEALTTYNRASANSKLLTIWSLYHSLGRGVTHTVPVALFSQVVQSLLRQFGLISREEQTEVLRDMVSGAETRFAQEYAALNINMKLAFWYRLTQLMPRLSAVSDPQDHQQREQLHALLRCVERMDLNQQIHFLKTAIEAEG